MPYALSTYPDEPGKLYMLIDAGDVYVEELDYNAAGTITHAETVSQITPAILNTFAAFGGYEDETDVVSDNGGSGGDASGITDLYVDGDYAWFLVTYAEDAAAGTDFNYIARFARTDSAITAPGQPSPMRIWSRLASGRMPIRTASWPWQPTVES